MIALEVKNLKVRLGNEEIIKGISFKLEEGTITALIGPNGAGKSVLLKTLVGLYPYKGEIKIFNNDHFKMLNFLGYLPQHYSVDPSLPLTLYEFIEKSVFENKNKQKIEEILKEVGIFELKNKLLYNLSGGQLQRALFARAILNEPKILLLDEPISEIDIVGQKEFYEIIKNLNQNKKTTILVVSHEITIIHQFANRVLCLNRSLICDGPISELFKEEILKKLYQQDIFIYPFNKPV